MNTDQLNTALDYARTAQQDYQSAAENQRLAVAHLAEYQAALVARKPPELAAYIVDNRSYNTTLTNALLAYLDVLANRNARYPSRLKRVILWQNKQQLAAGFPLQILDRGLEWDADTIYKVRTLLNDADFAKYLTQAEALKVSAYRFDDAHNQPPEVLAKVIQFMRLYTNKPLIGSFGALDQRKDVQGRVVPIDMQAYKDAGLQIFRQFYRQDQVDTTPADATKYDPTQVISDWLNSGRITDGIDLEGYREGTVLTSASDFDSMFLRALAAGIRQFTIYAVVNESGFLMWQHAPALWRATNRAADMLRSL